MHPGLYAVLFGPEADQLGVPFEGSAGQEAFAALLDPVYALVGDPAESWPRATNLWASMHGIVTLRAAVPGFPRGDLDAQLDRDVDQLLASCHAADRRVRSEHV